MWSLTKRESRKRLKLTQTDTQKQVERAKTAERQRKFIKKIKGSAKEVELKKVKSEITQRWKQQHPEKQRIYNQTYAQRNRSEAKARESDEGIDLD